MTKIPNHLWKKNCSKCLNSHEDSQNHLKRESETETRPPTRSRSRHSAGTIRAVREDVLENPTTSITHSCVRFLYTAYVTPFGPPAAFALAFLITAFTSASFTLPLLNCRCLAFARCCLSSRHTVKAILDVRGYNYIYYILLEAFDIEIAELKQLWYYRQVKQSSILTNLPVFRKTVTLSMSIDSEEASVEASETCGACDQSETASPMSSVSVRYASMVY